MSGARDVCDDKSCYSVNGCCGREVKREGENWNLFIYLPAIHALSTCFIFVLYLYFVNIIRIDEYTKEEFLNRSYISMLYTLVSIPSPNDIIANTHANRIYPNEGYFFGGGREGQFLSRSKKSGSNALWCVRA